MPPCVSVKSLDCPHLRTEAQFAIRVHEDVVGGSPTCLVEPRQGGEFTHLFSVKCTGFESGPKRDHYHYRYYVKSASHPEGVSGSLS